MMRRFRITARTWGLFGVFVGSLAWVLATSSSGRSSRREKPLHPMLFEGFEGCPSGRRSNTSPDELLRDGRHRAARYPYDPGDGIRAVRHLRCAETRYRSLGLNAQADEVRRSVSTLRARIDADYASSRLLLDEALAISNWDIASREVSRLLTMTAHLNGDAYVDWLREISGKVTTRATAAP